MSVPVRLLSRALANTLRASFLLVGDGLFHVLPDPRGYGFFVEASGFSAQGFAVTDTVPAPGVYRAVYAGTNGVLAYREGGPVPGVGLPRLHTVFSIPVPASAPGDIYALVKEGRVYAGFADESGVPFLAGAGAVRLAVRARDSLLVLPSHVLRVLVSGCKADIGLAAEPGQEPRIVIDARCGDGGYTAHIYIRRDPEAYPAIIAGEECAEPPCLDLGALVGVWEDFSMAVGAPGLVYYSDGYAVFKAYGLWFLARVGDSHGCRAYVLTPYRDVIYFYHNLGVRSVRVGDGKLLGTIPPAGEGSGVDPGACPSETINKYLGDPSAKPMEPGEAYSLMAGEGFDVSDLVSGCCGDRVVAGRLGDTVFIGCEDCLAYTTV